jgi:hypothetical protein
MNIFIQKIGTNKKTVKSIKSTVFCDILLQKILNQAH